MPRSAHCSNAVLRLLLCRDRGAEEVPLAKDGESGDLQDLQGEGIAFGEACALMLCVGCKAVLCGIHRNHFFHGVSTRVGLCTAAVCKLQGCAMRYPS